MPKIKLPSIETPRDNDFKSMGNAIGQIKEAIELMSGQRGPGMFLTEDDLSLVKQNFIKHQNNTWETIADEYIPSLKGKDYLDLGAYHTLRATYHLMPLTVGTGWPYMRIGDDTGVTASGYSGNLFYTTEGATTVNNAVQPETSTIPLSWTNAVAASQYGCHGVMVIDQFNQALQTVMFTDVSWYTGTYVLHGSFIVRTAEAKPYNRMHIAMAGDATDFALRMLLEGKKR